jgi:hypothetical protein
VRISNVGFLGGSAERGGAIQVMADPSAVDAADRGAVQVKKREMGGEKERIDINWPVAVSVCLLVSAT